MNLSKNFYLKTTVVFLTLVVFYLLDRFLKQGFSKAPEVFAGKLAWLPFGKEVYFNTGSIFSWNLPSALIIVVGILILLLVVWFWLKAWINKNWKHMFAWGLVFVGGFSNLLDRFLFGHVIDWWQMPWQAVINLADIYVFAGVILLFVFSRNKH